jgi:hypothetical protein
MAKGFNPGGHKGKLHRELNIPEDQKIPPERLQAAMNSPNREVRNDAIRAKTMEGWDHRGGGGKKKKGPPAHAARYHKHQNIK